MLHETPPAPPPIDFPITDTAEVFGVSRTTIFNWIHAGKLKAKKRRGQWYIPQEAIERQAGKERLTQWKRERRKRPGLHTMPGIVFWLHIDRKTAYKWIKEGKLKAEKIGGKWRVEHNYLVHFAELKYKQEHKGAECREQLEIFARFRRGEGTDN